MARQIFPVVLFVPDTGVKELSYVHPNGLPRTVTIPAGLSGGLTIAAAEIAQLVPTADVVVTAPPAPPSFAGAPDPAEARSWATVLMGEVRRQQSIIAASLPRPDQDIEGTWH